MSSGRTSMVTLSERWAENWWPIEFLQTEYDAIETFRQYLRAHPQALDLKLASGAAQALAVRMRAAIASIIATDSLPHLAHVLNGWGDARFESQGICDRLLPFVHCKTPGVGFIRQKDPEGDFHPWQSFAYAVMAGVSPQRRIGGRPLTLDELAYGSTQLEIRLAQTEELGHLLFAVAGLSPKVHRARFHLQDGVALVEELFDLAVQSHEEGAFTVCRKFHLTEGIYSAAARIPALRGRRRIARYFLDGQLDMLLVLGAILFFIRLHRQGVEDHTAAVEKLRGGLVLNHLVENHYYYAGHLFELAMFAYQTDYPLRAEHVEAMCFIANELNALLPQVLQVAPFHNSFLHFGHYRRGVTLLREFAVRRATSRHLTRKAVRSYTCDFDRMPPETVPVAGSNGVIVPRLLKVQLEEPPVNDALESAVTAFNHLAPHGLAATGAREHFRRIIPSGWPRGLHYEFLADADRLGVELHMEDDIALEARPIIKELGTRLGEEFTDVDVLWDSSWYRGRGRLILSSAAPADSGAIALRMIRLINRTFPAIDSYLRSARGVAMKA